MKGGNDSKEQVLGQFSLYTGLAVVGITAVNPTKEEAEKLGYNLKEEPKYEGIEISGNNGTQTFNRLTFYLKGKNKAIKVTESTINPGELNESFEDVEVSARRDFLVKPETRISTQDSTNLQFVNKFGNFTWAKSKEALLANEKMKWFYKDTESEIREALIGEEEVTEFLREFMNMGSKEEGILDNPKNIFNLNLTEIKDILKRFPNNQVVVLLGVKEGEGKNEGKEFQTVYNKCTSRPTAPNPQQKFHKALNEKYGEFNANHGEDFRLRIYEKKVEATKPDTEKTGGENPW